MVRGTGLVLGQFHLGGKVHDFFEFLDLERIRIDRSHFVALINPVNPLDINRIEQIHAIERIAKAIPLNPDLL